MAKYKAAKAKAAGPKRALSAFFMFAADERPKVVSANPSASIGEIGKELGARYDNVLYQNLQSMNNIYIIWFLSK